MRDNPLTPTAGLPRIREMLARSNYTEKGLVDLLGAVQLPTHSGPDLPYFLHLTRHLGPLELLARLFVLGVPVTAEAARRALEPVPLQEWRETGLFALEGDTVQPRVRLLPFRGLLLACDHFDLHPANRQDLVMGITGSTVELADFALRQKVSSTLDLGTGSGVQAFLAAPHSGRVCALDNSARSLNFARFNAALNSVAGVDFREGDAFEPVEGERFDLVLSNPPFAVTPGLRYSYRDSGRELDGFCRALVREAPRFLNEGGFCQITCDWVHLRGQDWKERLAGWFDGSGCDGWVLRTETKDPAAYAHVWIRDTERLDLARSTKLYDEWLGYYDRMQVEAISTGLIALRRRSATRNWLRLDDAPATTSGAFGDYVALGFELRDYLESVRPSEALLGARLRVAPAARLDQNCEWSDGAWRIASARIRLAQGLQYSSEIDLRLAGLVARCDGRHTAGELLAEMARALGLQLDEITPNCLNLLRELIERGFLLPVPNTGVN